MDHIYYVWYTFVLLSDVKMLDNSLNFASVNLVSELQAQNKIKSNAKAMRNIFDDMVQQNC
jgi:hypothetical protein